MTTIDAEEYIIIMEVISKAQTMGLSLTGIIVYILKTAEHYPLATLNKIIYN